MYMFFILNLFNKNFFIKNLKKRFNSYNLALSREDAYFKRLTKGSFLDENQKNTACELEYPNRLKPIYKS